MSISLYDATIPGYLQILDSVAGLLDKAEVWCVENNQSPEFLIQARLAADMLPFAYQISSCAWHSIGAIDGVRNGVFHPDTIPPPADFDGLRKKIGNALAQLQTVSKEEVESFIGQSMRFEAGQFKLNFVAEQFLLSFSQPNFYFHAATAYDILRWKGLSIGKVDFLGKLRKL